MRPFFFPPAFPCGFQRHAYTPCQAVHVQTVIISHFTATGRASDVVSKRENRLVHVACKSLEVDSYNPPLQFAYDIYARVHEPLKLYLLSPIFLKVRLPAAHANITVLPLSRLAQGTCPKPDSSLRCSGCSALYPCFCSCLLPSLGLSSSKPKLVLCSMPSWPQCYTSHRLHLLSKAHMMVQAYFSVWSQPVPCHAVCLLSRVHLHWAACLAIAYYAGCVLCCCR